MNSNSNKITAKSTANTKNDGSQSSNSNNTKNGNEDLGRINNNNLHDSADDDMMNMIIVSRSTSRNKNSTNNNNNNNHNNNNNIVTGIGTIPSSSPTDGSETKRRRATVMYSSQRRNDKQKASNNDSINNTQKPMNNDDRNFVNEMEFFSARNSQEENSKMIKSSNSSNKTSQQQQSHNHHHRLHSASDSSPAINETNKYESSGQNPYYTMRDTRDDTTSGTNNEMTHTQEDTNKGGPKNNNIIPRGPFTATATGGSDYNNNNLPIVADGKSNSPLHESSQTMLSPRNNNSKKMCTFAFENSDDIIVHHDAQPTATASSPPPPNDDGIFNNNNEENLHLPDGDLPMIEQSLLRAAFVPCVAINPGQFQLRAVSLVIRRVSKNLALLHSGAPLFTGDVQRHLDDRSIAESAIRHHHDLMSSVSSRLMLKARNISNSDLIAVSSSMSSRSTIIKRNLTSNSASASQERAPPVCCYGVYRRTPKCLSDSDEGHKTHEKKINNNGQNQQNYSKTLENNTADKSTSNTNDTAATSPIHHHHVHTPVILPRYSENDGAALHNNNNNNNDDDDDDDDNNNNTKHNSSSGKKKPHHHGSITWTSLFKLATVVAANSSSSFISSPLRFNLMSHTSKQFEHYYHHHHNSTSNNTSDMSSVSLAKALLNSANVERQTANDDEEDEVHPLREFLQKYRLCCFQQQPSLQAAAQVSNNNNDDKIKNNSSGRLRTSDDTKINLNLSSGAAGTVLVSCGSSFRIHNSPAENIACVSSFPPPPSNKMKRNTNINDNASMSSPAAAAVTGTRLHRQVEEENLISDSQNNLAASSSPSASNNNNMHNISGIVSALQSSQIKVFEALDTSGGSTSNSNRSATNNTRRESPPTKPSLSTSLKPHQKYSYSVSNSCLPSAIPQVFLRAINNDTFSAGAPKSTPGFLKLGVDIEMGVESNNNNNNNNNNDKNVDATEKVNPGTVQQKTSSSDNNNNNNNNSNSSKSDQLVRNLFSGFLWSQNNNTNNNNIGERSANLLSISISDAISGNQNNNNDSNASAASNASAVSNNGEPKLPSALKSNNNVEDSSPSPLTNRRSPQPNRESGMIPRIQDLMNSNNFFINNDDDGESSESTNNNNTSTMSFRNLSNQNALMPLLRQSSVPGQNSASGGGFTNTFSVNSRNNDSTKMVNDEENDGSLALSSGPAVIVPNSKNLGKMVENNGDENNKKSSSNTNNGNNNNNNNTHQKSNNDGSSFRTATWNRKVSFAPGPESPKHLSLHSPDDNGLDDNDNDTSHSNNNNNNNNNQQSSNNIIGIIFVPGLPLRLLPSISYIQKLQQRRLENLALLAIKHAREDPRSMMMISVSTNATTTAHVFGSSVGSRHHLLSAAGAAPFALGSISQNPVVLMNSCNFNNDSTITAKAGSTSFHVIGSQAGGLKQQAFSNNKEGGNFDLPSLLEESKPGGSGSSPKNDKNGSSTVFSENNIGCNNNTVDDNNTDDIGHSLAKANNACILQPNDENLSNFLALGSITMASSFLEASPSLFDKTLRCSRYPGKFKPIRKLGAGNFGTAYLVLYQEPPNKEERQQLRSPSDDDEKTKISGSRLKRSPTPGLTTPKSSSPSRTPSPPPPSSSTSKLPLLRQLQEQREQHRRRIEAFMLRSTKTTQSQRQADALLPPLHRNSIHHQHEGGEGSRHHSHHPHHTGHPSTLRTPPPGPAGSVSGMFSTTPTIAIKGTVAHDTTNNNDNNKPSKHKNDNKPSGSNRTFSRHNSNNNNNSSNTINSREIQVPRERLFVCKVETLRNPEAQLDYQLRQRRALRPRWDDDCSPDTAESIKKEQQEAKQETDRQNQNDRHQNFSSPPPASSFFRQKLHIATRAANKNLDRMQNEAHILANLAHPNIVGFIDVFFDEKENKQYLFLEYVDGGDLRQEILKRCVNAPVAPSLHHPVPTAARLRSMSPSQQRQFQLQQQRQQQQSLQQKRFFSEQTALHIFVQIVLAVEYLHRHNILHRDIKSQNILLSKFIFAKLTDFGTSRQFTTDVDQNVDNTLKGTPLYMSPEQCSGMPYSQKCEMWSLGVLLYELLSCGEFPFFGRDMDDLRARICTASPTPIPRDPSAVSADVLRLLSCLLSKDPTRRPTAKQVLTKFPCMMQAASYYARRVEEFVTNNSELSTDVDRMWLTVIQDHIALIRRDKKSSQKSRLEMSLARGAESRHRSAVALSAGIGEERGDFEMISLLYSSNDDYSDDNNNDNTNNSNNTHGSSSYAPSGASPHRPIEVDESTEISK